MVPSPNPHWIMAATLSVLFRTFSLPAKTPCTRSGRIVKPDMHERKRLMFERSDAFVALPGGIGT